MNWIFNTGSKNPIRNRLKPQFVEIHRAKAICSKNSSHNFDRILESTALFCTVLRKCCTCTFENQYCTQVPKQKSSKCIKWKEYNDRFELNASSYFIQVF